MSTKIFQANWNISAFSKIEVYDLHEDFSTWINYQDIEVKFNNQEISLKLFKTTFGAEFYDSDHKILFEIITDKNQIIITNYFEYEIQIKKLRFKKSNI